jgi:hypothetical protein
MQVTALGYERLLSPVINLETSQQVPDLKTVPQQKQLKEVDIVVKKPYIERERGKLVLNVENSINAEGSSAFELLEKAPGVRTDNNDNISLNGKAGTAVWVDGKPTPMTGTDLANYLRGIPSSSIEKIEIISNPSAKYDAAGTAIINIKLKKDKRIGTNGSITASYGQGVYPKSNNSLSLNHRDKKVNVFGSYSFAHREAFSHLQLQRAFYNGDTLLGSFDQDNYLKFDFNTHVAKAGVDYYINKNNTLGFVVSGVDTRFSPNGKNTSDVYSGNQLGATGLRTSQFNTTNRSADHWYNYSANVNYKHVFDSTGTELTTDLDLAQYGNGTQQNFETKYYDLNYLEYQTPYKLYGNLNGGLQLASLKNDLSKNMKKGYKLECGQKSSYVLADNNLAFYNVSNGGSIYDSTKSNHFIYTENINAAYVSMSRELKKWSWQLGLRAEHTYVTGRQLVYQSGFTRNYVQLFPNLVTTYNLNEKNALELNYSRRIRRPGYDQLNPFKFYLDPTTYKEGNPYLQPSITESFEFSHIYRNKITTTLGFGRTFDNIIEVIAPLAGQPKITVQTNRNLAVVDVYALNCAVPLDIKKWWTSNNDVNIYYASYTGNIANTQLNGIGNLNLNFNSVNTFSLSKTWSAELTGNYRSKEVYAYDVIKPIWFVSAGVQKKLFNNKGTLKLNVNDIFFSNRIEADVAYTNYKEHFLVQRDTRVATLSFSYKFGKSSVPGARRRQGGAEDIKQRAGNGVG